MLELLKFKFHCDSINIVSNYKANCGESRFKFHCDSINIIIIRTTFQPNEDLNSTVILLILKSTISTFAKRSYLNSTVILLIFRSQLKTLC